MQLVDDLSEDVSWRVFVVMETIDEVWLNEGHIDGVLLEGRVFSPVNLDK